MCRFVVLRDCFDLLLSDCYLTCELSDRVQRIKYYKDKVSNNQIGSDSDRIVAFYRPGYRKIARI